MRGRSLDLKLQIRSRLASVPEAVWTPVDFLVLGPRAAVDKALQRLVKTHELARLDRGLYHMPRPTNRTGHVIPPETGAVIDAVARRDQARLLVDGLTAANDLGLTTNIPTEVVVQSDARLRPIRLGNRQIIFKQAAPSKLYWAGRPAMRIIQALHWLQDTGGEVPADEITERLRALLRDLSHGETLRDDLRNGLPTLPIWMQSRLRDLLNETDPALQLPLGRPTRRGPPTPRTKTRRRSTH